MVEIPPPVPAVVGVVMVLIDDDDGVRKARGVNGFPTTVTRCLGVTGPVPLPGLEKTSRCLGVRGVGVWMMSRESHQRELAVS